MPSDDAPPPSPAPLDAIDDASLTHLRTAWHPLLVLLLELLLPGDLWRVAAEYVLTREPRRIDAVIVRRVADAAARWHPEYLRSVLDGLREHNVVHFKGATDALERADALQLLSYAFQYMALEGVEGPGDLSLRVVAPTLTPRFRAQVEALGGALTSTAAPGVWDGALNGFALRVVETSVAWPSPGEHLLYAVSPACVEDPGRVRTFDDRERDLYYLLLQRNNRLLNDPRWKAMMKDAALVQSTVSKALRELLDSLPPEARLAGLPPEARLAGLPPEARLAGLPPEAWLAGLPVPQTVLAMPDEILRVLPESYLATLPADVQAAVRARLAR
ncbi:MAG: hypothetical protein U0324_23145 [Polyangiales bacterium]